MDKIIKEVISRQQKPFWQVVLVFLGAVLFINTLITLSNYLGEKYAGLVSITILLLSIGACGFIIINYLSSFNYKLTEEHLIFERVVGKRETTILVINLEEIRYLKPYRESKHDKEVTTTYKFVFGKDYDHFYVGEFHRSNKKYRFIFQPSDRIVRILDRNFQKDSV